MLISDSVCNSQGAKGLRRSTAVLVATGTLILEQDYSCTNVMSVITVFMYSGIQSAVQVNDKKIEFVAKLLEWCALVR